MFKFGTKESVVAEDINAIKNKPTSWAWWYMPVIPALVIFLRRKNHEYEASLSYIAISCLKKEKGQVPCTRMI
jgi:hypothetical protein